MDSRCVPTRIRKFHLHAGTSTHDGYALAYAVLCHLSSKTRCRTLFATHFHGLAHEVRTVVFVQMSCTSRVPDIAAACNIWPACMHCLRGGDGEFLIAFL